MAGELRTHARFPDVPPAAGHYESFYLKAAHPSEPLGVWIRHTVHKRPGAEPKGSLWFVLFDGAADGPRASKVTLPGAELGAGPDHYIHVGESRLSPGSAVGKAPTEQCDASWELEFDEGEEAFFHLPREWMYTARLPRTKLLTPYPASTFRGQVEVDGRRVELEGWPGMVGHNWGAQHAERWIWLHGSNFEGHGPDTWIDAAIGRIKIGPLTTPWVANGVLSIDRGPKQQPELAPFVYAASHVSPVAVAELSMPPEFLETRSRLAGEYITGSLSLEQAMRQMQAEMDRDAARAITTYGLTP